MLPDRGRPSDWLPTILVCTYWDRPGSPEPLLKIRTRENSDYEIGVLSHVSGFINERDLPEPELAKTSQFILPEEAPRRAAMRELREELGLTRRMDLELVEQIRFHAIDHESLYFYVFALPIPPSFGHFPKPSQVYPWSITELVQIRKHQVLLYTEELLSRPTLLTARQADLAARTARLNLVLHDLGHLGDTLHHAVYRREGPSNSCTSCSDSSKIASFPTPPVREASSRVWVGYSTATSSRSYYRSTSVSAFLVRRRSYRQWGRVRINGQPSPSSIISIRARLSCETYQRRYKRSRVPEWEVIRERHCLL